MFVLKNAWAALGRVKWRTALTALLALLVSFSAAVDLAVLRADDKANNETYQSQKASAVIRPSAKVTAKRDGADSNYTANYMTWDMYTKYAEAVQKNNLTFEYTLATSVPVRASKSLQAIAAKSDTSEDNTGGNLTLQAFYTNDAAKINDYGTGIPYHEVEALARVLLPEIQAFFESEEGQREFAEWKAQQRVKQQE